MPFLDLIADRSPAIAMCRQSIELARATVGAIAVGELSRLDAPIHRHRRLPRCCSNIQRKRRDSRIGTANVRLGPRRHARVNSAFGWPGMNSPTTGNQEQRL